MKDGNTKVISSDEQDEVAIDAIARTLVMIAKSLAEDEIKSNENIYEKSTGK